MVMSPATINDTNEPSPNNNAMSLPCYVFNGPRLGEKRREKILNFITRFFLLSDINFTAEKNPLYGTLYVISRGGGGGGGRILPQPPGEVHLFLLVRVVYFSFPALNLCPCILLTCAHVVTCH